MNAFRAYVAAVCTGMILAACGGSGSSIADPPADAAGGGPGTGEGGATGDSASNSETGSSTDGSSNVDSSTPVEAGRDASFLGDSALTLDGNDGGGCPNTLGGYAPLVATGMGCGDFNSAAKQCVLPVISGGSGTSNACLIRFNSEQPATIPAVNGPQLGADLKPDGTFDNATLRLGTNVRTGCVGSFDEVAQTMTVTCGGTGTSQSCTVTLVRSSVACP
jgi:hypothetical protein